MKRYEYTVDDSCQGDAPGEYFGWRLSFSGDDSAHDYADVDQMRQEYVAAIVAACTPTDEQQEQRALAAWNGE